MGLVAHASSSVAELIAAGGLRAVYQPIVDLDSGAVVGYEGLVRGPAGSPLEMPAALFGEAARDGIVGELDHACRGCAISTAAADGWEGRGSLFVNTEPAWLGPDAIFESASQACSAGISLVVELTERALTARPAEVLATVHRLRELGVRIALDDVGVDSRSLALMPFIAPDVIKVDRAIVQSVSLRRDAARVLNAIAAEAERSGSLILAEGIETDEQLRRARSMGARLGQGWQFGRPGELSASVRSPGEGWTLPRHEPQPDRGLTPFELIADQRALRRGDKHLLLALSRQLEHEALALGEEALLLSTFQHRRFFTGATSRLYEQLASRAAFVGALGVDLPSEPAAGVRGANLTAGDSLEAEWDVIVVAPHFAGAFVARDLGDQAADFDRRFDFFLTYDRSLVVTAAAALLRRVIPAS